METFRTDAFFIYVNNLNEETLTVIEIETLRKFNLFVVWTKTLFRSISPANPILTHVFFYNFYFLTIAEIFPK